METLGSYYAGSGIGWWARKVILNKNLGDSDAGAQNHSSGISLGILRTRLSQSY